MPIHVAILKRPYLRGILDGWKTIESRLYRITQPPYRCVREGERIFLKVSAGPWLATAIAAKVDEFDNLTPARVDQIRRDLGHLIGGDEEYWSLKRASRIATLVHLSNVEPFDVGPRYPVSQRAWHVLDESASPLREWRVTAGALRNGYALFPVESRESGPWAPAPALTLVMPGGESIPTALAAGRRLKWRGWRRLYEAHHVEPGGTLRFVALGDGRFRVSFPGAVG